MRKKVLGFTLATVVGLTGLGQVPVSASAVKSTVPNSYFQKEETDVLSVYSSGIKSFIEIKRNGDRKVYEGQMKNLDRDRDLQRKKIDYKIAMTSKKFNDRKSIDPKGALAQYNEEMTRHNNELKSVIDSYKVKTERANSELKGKIQETENLEKGFIKRLEDTKRQSSITVGKGNLSHALVVLEFVNDVQGKALKSIDVIENNLLDLEREGILKDKEMRLAELDLKVAKGLSQAESNIQKRKIETDYNNEVSKNNSKRKNLALQLNEISNGNVKYYSKTKTDLTNKLNN